MGSIIISGRSRWRVLQKSRLFPASFRIEARIWRQDNALKHTCGFLCTVGDYARFLVHTLLVLTLTTLLFPALSSSASSEAPSFDCAKARRDDEKAICADPSLGALDRSIDAAYRTARDRLRSDPAALKHLKEEQALTLAGRLDAFAHPSGNGLKYYLTGWRDALARITEPHAGFEGGWASMVTFIDVKGRPDGRFSVKVQGSDMIRGSWACEYNGLGENQGDRLVVA